ncbi:hypothetical protein QTP88_017680 [Uroleucon formosanum]
MQITGLWPTRSGQQIATARMTRAAASSISRVPIGWTMCRVRPRRSEPGKCFRCHGFGHQSGNCSGPDLSSNCKRCGEPGHELKQCLADKDLCVACERAGFERYEHKPGSGMCKARKEAIKKPTGRHPQTQSRQSLLQETSAATGAQILIVSEQNWNPTHDDRWVASTDGTCEVALTATADFVPDLIGAGRGFAWIQSRGIRIYSCYISRNDTDANFANFLGDVEQSVRSVDLHCSVIIGGDFNAWSQEWGSARNEARGDQLADLAAILDLLVGNVGTKPTYRRRNAESVIDVTFHRCQPCLALTHWRVMDEVESVSDHSYIQFWLERFQRTPDQDDPPERLRGWAYRQLNLDALTSHLAIAPLPAFDENTPTDQAADQYISYLTSSCDACMPPRAPPPHGRRQAH